MSSLKAVLTFDDSWDDEAVRNAFADNDQFPGVTLAEVTSTECGVCARQNKGSAEQQTDNKARQCATQICPNAIEVPVVVEDRPGENVAFVVCRTSGKLLPC